jgi:transcriptional regulator with XRE-family HTH domain
MSPAAKPSTLSASTLAGILRRRRQQLGLSMREAARRIGISPSYLAALEQGRNPSTGRAPVPSPPILTTIARVLDIELATLLHASGVPMPSSVHVLLYQTGAGYQSPLGAARCLFAGRVDAWIEILDPRRPGDTKSSPNDILISSHVSLSEPRSGKHVFETTRALGALADLLAEASRSSITRPRLGIIFGASSALLRSIENPPALLESETTWERDVAAEFQAALGVEPAANICVYREADFQELAARFDPLAALLSLIQSHPHITVQSRSGVLVGPAAIETILAAARPAGVGSETWESLARVAAAGLAHEQSTAHQRRGES